MKLNLPRHANSLFASALSAAEETSEAGERSNFSEVMSDIDSTSRVLAMNKEIKSFQKSKTWTLVMSRKGKKVFCCKWIFK